MGLGNLGAVFYDIVANDMTGAGITSSRAGLMALGAAFTGVGMASASMVEDIRDSFLEFDTAMTEVKALGGLTTDEFNSMRDAAFDLSSTMPITATDFANAMYLMVSVGYDYQTMMNTIPEAAQLAVAGSMQMAEATNAIINVMGAYGEETYTAAEITKVFANAVGVGKYEMTDFMTEIMKNIGVASQLGIEFSDLAAYNVAIQNSFTSAEEAGTSFNRMLISLTDPKTVETLRSMGIAVTDSGGKFRDLTDILADLKTALSLVTDDAERMGIVTDLFGTYGQRAAFALMDQVDASNDAAVAYAMFSLQVAEVTDEITKLTDANESLTDSLKRGDLQMESLQLSRRQAVIDLEKLTSGQRDSNMSTEEYSIRLERAKLRIREIDQQIIDLTKTQEKNREELKNNQEKIEDYNDEISGLESSLHDVTEGLQGTSSGINDTGSASHDATGKIADLKEKMKDLDLINGQASVKIGSVASQTQIAKNKTEEAAIVYGEAMAPAMIFTADATKGLADVLIGLPEPLQAIGGMGLYAAQGLQAVGHALMGIAALKMLGLGGILTSISGALASIPGAISGLLAGMSTDIAAGGMAAGGSLAAAIGAGAVLGLAGVWILVKTGVMQGISDIGRSIESSPLGSVVMDALKIILAPIGSLGAGIIALVRGDFARIPEVMIAPFEQADEAIGRNIDRIRAAFSGIGSTVAGGVSQLGDAVRGMINSFAGMGAIGGYASAAFGNIGGAFNAMAGQVRGVFSQMFSSILGLIQSTAGGFYNAGMNIITSIVNGIVAAAGGIVTAIASALNQVRALFPFSPAKEGPLAETPNWGTWMTQGMEKAGPEVAAAASSNLAAPVAAGVAGAAGGAGAGAGSGGSTSITISPGAIVINGAGQNAEEIANQVIAKLSQQMASTRKARGLIA